MKKNKVIDRRILLQAIGQIDDELIAAYDQTLSGDHLQSSNKRDRKKQRYIRYAAVAASLVLVASGLFSAFHFGLLTMGGARGGYDGVGLKTVPADTNAYPVSPAPDGQDNVPETIPVFMFYDGPILPLTVLEKTDGLSVSRHLHFDFAPYISQMESYTIESKDGIKEMTHDVYRTESHVTDTYQLTNETEEEIEITIAYPYASSLVDLAESSPKLTLAGESLETRLHIGAYSGDFEGAWGGSADQRASGSLNLKQIDSWLGYHALLENGQYQTEAFTDPIYKDRPVTVYEFSDFDIISGEGQNPSLAVSYQADDTQSTVLSYGFHGMHNLGEGAYIQGFSIPTGERLNMPQHRYTLIVIGKDIEDISLQGYENMGFDRGTEITIDAEVTRYETTLNKISRELLDDYFSIYDSMNSHINEDTSDEPGQSGNTMVDQDLIFEAVYDHLYTHGLFAGIPAQRYEEGWLMDLFSEAQRVDRVVYLTADIKIPAGQNQWLEVALTKRGSHDFYLRKDAVPDVKGYDLATRLGSSISFTEQTASISDHDAIAIVKQNFGFNLAQGINTVTLDLSQPYYYMLVKKLGSE